MSKKLLILLFLLFPFLMGQQSCQTTQSSNSNGARSGRGGGGGFRLFGNGRTSGDLRYEVPGDPGPNGMVTCGSAQSTFQCLMCNCYHEARGESPEGRVAINKVVMTRVGMSSFPNTVCSVVYQPSQFSWTLSSRKRNQRLTREGYNRCYNSVREAFQFRGHYASHYHTRAVWPDWRDDRNPTRFRIGVHQFYRRLRSERPEVEAPNGYQYNSTVKNFFNKDIYAPVCKNI